ncbi:MAG: hypothetical protein CM1200mP29_05410 [Verrucomicrobiota bacterium]|nr:MAG: hypothetical protein CM1200mP29_05410 [Verrucomicrobiota bacterium]
MWTFGFSAAAMRRGCCRALAAGDMRLAKHIELAVGYFEIELGFEDIHLMPLSRRKLLPSA